MKRDSLTVHKRVPKMARHTRTRIKSRLGRTAPRQGPVENYFDYFDRTQRLMARAMLDALYEQIRIKENK